MRWWKQCQCMSARQLNQVQSLMQTAIKNQEKLMAILEELKGAVDDIANDAMAQHDEVLVAIDHIMKGVDLDSNPDLKAAVEALRTSHSSFTDSLKTLKDKVDAVTASGGPAV